MPGIYREKLCGHCGTLHRRRGPYCGTPCANKAREVSAETREKLARARREYARTPEGVNNSKRLTETSKAIRSGQSIPVYSSQEDHMVSIPDVPPELPEGYEVGGNW